MAQIRLSQMTRESVFGVTSEQIDQLVSPLVQANCSDSSSEHALADAFCRAALSKITEPADMFAGALLSSIGSITLLNALIRKDSAAAFVNTLAQVSLELGNLLEEKFQTPVASLWNAALERWCPRVDFADIQRNLKSFKSLKGSLVTPDSPNYPSGLSDLELAKPHVLWALGDPTILRSERLVSLVGSRAATGYGGQVCAELASAAAENSIVTVSGGAFGIDSLIHRSSLALESPTIAVLAGGLDNLYPRANEDLFRRIQDCGVIVAEVAPGVTPAKWRFLQRNRLIAAISQATVVVEAGSRSGSINTANTALELQRSVAVVPGSLFSSASVGCHKLLREHPAEVQLLSKPQDLVELLGIARPLELVSPDLGALETRALDSFGKKVLAQADVQRIAGLTRLETQIALGRLELLGLIVRHNQGFKRLSNTL